MSFRTLAVFTLSILLAACATPVKTDRLITAGQPVDGPFERLLVIDVASDRSFRHDFEDAIVTRLVQSGADAIKGHRVLTDTTDLKHQALVRLAEANGADGILVTQLLSLETSVEKTEGREDIIRTCRKGSPVDYFLYDSVVVKEPDSAKLSLTAVVVSRLYTLTSAEPVWAIQSTCFKKDSVADVVIEEATAIVRQLRFDGMI